MTLAIVDPLGQYNTDHGTSWLAHDEGAKCIYLPSAGEFWVLLETGTGPSKRIALDELAFPARRRDDWRLHRDGR